MRLKTLFILLLLITPVLAQEGEDIAMAAREINTFLVNFSQPLSALSVAAIAAMGIKVALKKVPGFADDNVLNGVIVAIFLAIFVLVYTSGLVIFFAPAVGFLVLAGFGSILWAVRKGMTSMDGEMKSFGNIVGGIGCLLLAWFAMQISYMEGGGATMTWAAIGFGVLGAILLFIGAKELNLFKGIKFGSGSSSTTGSNPDKDDIDDEKIDDEAEDEAEQITADNFDDKVNEVKDEVRELIKQISLTKEELIKALEGLKP